MSNQTLSLIMKSSSKVKEKIRENNIRKRLLLREENLLELSNEKNSYFNFLATLNSTNN